MSDFYEQFIEEHTEKPIVRQLRKLIGYMGSIKICNAEDYEVINKVRIYIENIIAEENSKK